MGLLSLLSRARIFGALQVHKLLPFSRGQQFVQNPKLTTQYLVLAAAFCSYGLATGTPPSLTCPKPLPPKATTVAFLYPNRSRSYRDYYVGIRLRTLFLSEFCPDASESYQSEQPTKSCQVQNTFPGAFDFRFGEDETVTGGHPVPIVMAVAGDYPLPSTNGAVRIFGSGYFRLHRNQNSPAVVLIPSTTFSPFSDPSVVVQRNSAVRPRLYSARSRSGSDRINQQMGNFQTCLTVAGRKFPSCKGGLNPNLLS
jgi:hypothetical protein